MDEDLDPLTARAAPGAISHRDILLAMAVLVVIGAGAGFAFGGLRWGFGVIVGGVLSYVNYLWLDRSTKAMFIRTASSLPAIEDEELDDTGRFGQTAVLAGSYIFRYFVIGAVLLAIYLMDAFPLAAVILGLAAFAFAVVFQGIKNIFSS